MEDEIQFLDPDYMDYSLPQFGGFMGVDDDLSGAPSIALNEEKRKGNMAKTLLFSPIGLVAGAADTIGQSLGLLDEGDVHGSLNAVSGAFGRAYSRDEKGFRTTSDIVTAVIPVTGATKLARGGEYARKGMKLLGGTGKYAGMPFSNHKRLQAMQRMIDYRSKQLVKQGVINLQDDQRRDQLIRVARKQQLLNSSKEALAAELALYMTHNQSEFWFPEGMNFNDYLQAGAFGVGLGAGIDRVIFDAGLRKGATALGQLAKETQEGFGFRAITENKQAVGMGLESYGRAANDSRAAMNSGELGPEGREAMQAWATAGENKFKAIADTAAREKPLPIVSKPYDLTDEQRSLLLDKTKGDARTFDGLTSFESPDVAIDYPNQARAAVATLNDRLEEIRKKRARTGEDNYREESKLLQQQRELEENAGFLIEADGKVIADGNRKAVIHDKKIQKHYDGKFMNGQGMYKARDGKKVSQYGVTNYGQVFKGKERVNDLSKLSHYEVSEVYAAAKLANEDFAKRLDQDAALRVGIAEDFNYIEADFVIKQIEDSGQKALARYDFPKGMDFDQFKFATLDKKYQDYAKVRDAESALVKSDENYLRSSPNDLGKRLGMDFVDETGNGSAVLELFEDSYVAGARELKEPLTGIEDLDTFYLRLEQNRAIGQATDVETIASKVEGREANLFRDMIAYPDGIEPVGMLKNMKKRDRVHDMTLLEQAKMERQLVEQRLVDTERVFKEAGGAGDSVIKHTLAKLDGLEELTAQARNVGELLEGQIARTNLTPQQRAFKGRDQPTIQAASRIDADIRRALTPVIDERFKKIRLSVGKITGPNHRADMLSYNSYTTAYGQGWELADDAVSANFALDPASSRNQQKWKEMFGSDMPTDAKLPDPFHSLDGKYAPLHITELAQEVLSEIKAIDRTGLAETNAMQSVHQKHWTRRRNGHVPAFNLKDQSMAFVVDSASGKPVSNGIQVGKDEATARANADKLVGKLNAQGGKRYHVIDSQQVEAYYQLRDRAFSENLSNFSDTIAQNKGKGTRGAAQLIANDDSILQGQIKSLYDGSWNTVRRTVATKFEPELNFTDVQRQVANPKVKDAKGRKQFDDVYSLYTDSLLGLNSSAQSGLMRGLNESVEGAYDSFVSDAMDKTVAKFNKFSGKTMSEKDLAEVSQQLKDELGYAPVSGALDLLEKTTSYKPDSDVRDLMNNLNGFTSLVVLRMFEAGHALLNITSLGATIPGVSAMYRRKRNESAEEYRTRIGAFSHVTGDGDAVPSAAKTFASGMHFMFTDEGRRISKLASDQGYFAQQVSEVMESITAPSHGYASQLKEKLIGNKGYLTYLTDKSEEMSRQVSFMVGANLVKSANPGLSDDALLAFANKFADDAIGDYRPSNRPEVFQGAAGAPLGLFQTFVVNYYQRMFSMIENKTHRALAVQYGTQASLFGVESVPGFSQYNEYIGATYDGSSDPVDRLTEAYGSAGAEILLSGSLSNIPRLFGAGDGISMFTRGDVNLRSIPGASNPADLPWMVLGKKMFDGVDATLKSFKDNEGINGNRLLEIAAHASPNRTLRGGLEVAAGYSTTRNSDLINQNTQDSLSIAARALGMKKTSEVRLAQSLWKNKSMDLETRAGVNRLRNEAAAMFRSGSLDNGEISKLLNKYVAYGRDPGHFESWLNEVAVKALVGKRERELMDKLGKPQFQTHVDRLLGL